MAEFELLPQMIKQAVLRRIGPGERIRMCFVAKAPLALGRDFVVITDLRVLVVDERRLAGIGGRYANVRGDIPIGEILEIEIRRGFKDRMLGQCDLSLRLEAGEFIIRGASFGEVKAAVELINSLRKAGARPAG